MTSLFSIHDVANKILSRASNYIVDVVTWPKFANFSVSMRKVIITSILLKFDQKNRFLWGWFKFNKLELALDKTLQFYAIMSKMLKLKVKKFWGLIPTFVEVTSEKLVGDLFVPSSWISLKAGTMFANFFFQMTFTILRIVG